MHKVVTAGLVLAALTLASCGGTEITDLTDVAGTYNLESVNGAPPPGVLSQTATTKVELISGDYVLGTDAQYNAIIGVRTTQSGNVTTEQIPEQGFYKRSGSKLTFLSDNNAISTGTVSGGKITFRSSNGLVTVFSM